MTGEAEARRLRAEGLSIAEIQRRLGVTKHRLTDWLRGIPAPAWTARPNAKDELHGRAVDLRGEGCSYWCEGAKAKPWRPSEWPVSFINSDPMLVRLFLTFIEGRGFARDHLVNRVSIHESADAEAASRWWAEQVSVDLTAFRRPTLKRHRPATNRRNTGDSY